jgi:hypothetical protein
MSEVDVDDTLTNTANHAWDTEAGTLHNDAWPLQLGFHSFDPVMAVTDDTDKIWYVVPPLAPFRVVALGCLGVNRPHPTGKASNTH